VITFGVAGKLKLTVESTNPAESMIECVCRAEDGEELAVRRHGDAVDCTRDALGRQL
jgi:hypothetical protein